MVDAKAQMEFQERLSNTAHQREIKDLQAAGLNPVLSAGGSGASTPSGAMDSQYSSGGGSSSAKQATQIVKSVAKAVEKATANTAKSVAESIKNIGETHNEQWFKASGIVDKAHEQEMSFNNLSPLEQAYVTGAVRNNGEEDRPLYWVDDQGQIHSYGYVRDLPKDKTKNVLRLIGLLGGAAIGPWMFSGTATTKLGAAAAAKMAASSAGRVAAKTGGKSALRALLGRFGLGSDLAYRLVNNAWQEFHSSKQTWSRTKQMEELSKLMLEGF